MVYQVKYEPNSYPRYHTTNVLVTRHQDRQKRALDNRLSDFIDQSNFISLWMSSASRSIFIIVVLEIIFMQLSHQIIILLLLPLCKMYV